MTNYLANVRDNDDEHVIIVFVLPLINKAKPKYTRLKGPCSLKF